MDGQITIHSCARQFHSSRFWDDMRSDATLNNRIASSLATRRRHWLAPMQNKVFIRQPA
jgi:hypothetical protein